MTTPGDEVRGPAREVPDVLNVARPKKLDDQPDKRKRGGRRKKKSGDQIASGDAQHDIGPDGEESINHSVDYLA